ncbi:MAG: VWA domain-containing protein [Acidobacteriota bacterium]|nr:MAG: VWA domain-containing protein [Acidobacteriota bacterium]
MKRSNPLFLLLILVCLIVPATAQGIIFPRPCPEPRPRCPRPPEVPTQPLKVKSIRLATTIRDQAAVTHVVQVFENETPFVIEGVYFFPLPDNVSITEFALWDGDKRLVGEARPREEARRIYDRIVRSRRDPALLEYAGKNLFQAAIFPIAPHSEKKIELTYSQALEGEQGTVAYRYPLGTGWRAKGWAPPRPIPMTGSRIPPQRRTGPKVDVSGEIRIHSKTPIKGIYSPSHDIAVDRKGEFEARVTFETGAAPADLRLFYTLSRSDFGVSLLSHREPGRDGYFMLLVSPRAELDRGVTSARDVVFVLDTSGSMAEAGKIDKAKAALRFGVNALDDRDRFNLIAFAGEERLLSAGLIEGNQKGKREALEFIEKLRATGGTNINDALFGALRQFEGRGDGRPRMIVFLTDGQPTVGETNAAKILSNARDANKNGIRIFSFGVGYDVNTLLLDGLSGENRGTTGYIEPDEDIEIKVSNFFSKVNHPVLSDIKLDWSGIETDLVYPRVLPDIFHGSQLLLIGRYKEGRKAGLNLTGNVNGRERRFSYADLQFADGRTGHEFLPHLWAMRRVGFLLDQIKSNGESKELRDEIVDLGTRFGIVTPYTSYLVLEPGMRDLGSRPGIVPGRPVPMAMETIEVSGRSAVQSSKRKAALQSADKVSADAAAGPMESSIRRIGSKTFYLRDGSWVDSEFKPEEKLPQITLTFAGDEYFDLLTKEPDLADFFSLGDKLTVVWKGKVYVIK